MYETKILFLFIIFILFTSCVSTRIQDNGTGTSDIRTIQSKIRDGETDLAITNSKITEYGEQVTESVNELEQSIRESTVTESEIGNILERIRTRQIPENK